MAETLLPTYEEALAYLDTFTNYERRSDWVSGPETLGLTRISRLLDVLGNPHLRYSTIHVAGTKGKGSTCTFTAAVLSRSGGLKVGLYTSPHLVSIRERIMIGGRPISRSDFCEAFARVRVAAEAVAEDQTLKPPTYFEFLTAIAFTAFASAGVDVAVVEVGMGGRFDATNVVSPSVCAITPISLDHTRQLGDTLEEIAREKAGIIKPDVPVIIGEQQRDVLAVLRDIAEDRCSPMRVLGESLRVERSGAPPRMDQPQTGQRINISTWTSEYSDVPLRVLGGHQWGNAAVAAGLCESFLSGAGLPMTERLLRDSWERLGVPGRVEVIGSDPWVVLDGAHNPASIWMLTETLRERFSAKSMALVFSAAEDKDVAGMLRILMPLASHVYLTRCGSPREIDLDRWAKELSRTWDTKVVIEPRPSAAVECATRDVRGSDDALVCVTGSLYLVGRVKEHMAGLRAAGRL